MAYSVQKAWRESGRLLAICLGFDGQALRKLTRLEHKYNDNTEHHEITLKLEIKHNQLIKGVNSVMIESMGIGDIDLIREINSRID